LLICDSQAVKNTDTADISTKGFCHYKATNGIKRHLCVDVLGTPFFVACTPANVSDDAGLLRILGENVDFFLSLPDCKPNLSFDASQTPVFALTILVDSGYNPSVILKGMDAIDGRLRSKVNIEVAPKMSPQEKKERGLSGFVVVAWRWIVERSNSWMEKCRLLWKNSESQLSTSVAQIQLCFIRLILKRICPKT
jgi:transposase